MTTSITQALSLTQPFATLCCATDPITREPTKPFETRSWRILPHRLPLRIAIHASLGFGTSLDRAHMTRATDDDDTRRLFRPQYSGPLHDAGFSALDCWQKTYAAGSPGFRLQALGAIVGAATIVEILPSDAITRLYQRHGISARAYALGNFAPGRFAWRLVDPLLLDEPIPCKGAQGLWKIPAPIAVQLSDLDVAAHAAA